MTVINNAAPAPAENSGNNGMGFLLGVIILIVFVFFLIYYGLPLMRNMGSPQINVPNKMDVNVHQTK